MKLALSTLGASLLLAGCAAGPKADDHAAHHPAGPAATAPAAPMVGRMDSMMKSMHDMHARMMAAKTPEERAAMMQDHMKLMQEGMAMTGPMRGGKGGMGMGGGMSMSPEMMAKRMDMMEMMMQMMIDREALRAPAAK